MADLDNQRRQDQRILEAARHYRRTYRAWRKLDRDPNSKVDARLDAQQANAAAERALLGVARGE